MFSSAVGRKVVALTLTLLTVVITTPVSASDFSTSRTPLGALTAIGTVELRGLSATREGTIFSGDRLRAMDKAYAKVSLNGGHSIELGERTDLTFTRDVNQVRVALVSGTVGFSSVTKDPLAITVGPYVIASKQPSSGNVAVLDKNAIGVRVIDGAVTVTNADAHTSFQVLRGQERLLSVKNSTATVSLGELASNMPSALPSPRLDPPPQAPAPSGSTLPGGGGSQCGICMDAGGWAAVIATVAVVGAGIGALVWNLERGGGNSVSAAVKTEQSNVQVLQNSSQQATTTGNQLSSTASAANSAIAAANVNPTTKATLAAQAATIQSQAQATLQQIATLQSQLQTLQSQLATTTNFTQVASINTQIGTVNNTLTFDISILNGQISQLNSLIQAAVAAGVPNVPNVTIQTIPPPVLASSSTP